MGTLTGAIRHIVQLRSVHLTVCVLYFQQQHYISQIKCVFRPDVGGKNLLLSKEFTVEIIWLS